MTLEMPKLKFTEDALEPLISSETIKYHYHKHTKKYFDTVNELVEGTIYEGKPLQSLVNKDSLTKMGNKLLNNVCQAYNHAFYWDCLTPADNSGEPSKELMSAIEDDFESFDTFKGKFIENATTLFGSGWTWLYLRDGKLYIKNSPNAGTPLTVPNQHPLLVCDVWEHAYYVDNPADRATYIDSFWKLINWEFVNNNFEQARK